MAGLQGLCVALGAAKKMLAKFVNSVNYNCFLRELAGLDCKIAVSLSAGTSIYAPQYQQLVNEELDLVLSGEAHVMLVECKWSGKAVSAGTLAKFAVLGCLRILAVLSASALGVGTINAPARQAEAFIVPLLR